MSCLLNINVNKIVHEANGIKIFLDEEDNNRKMFVFREFESELLEIISNEKEYNRILKRITQEYSGETIKEDFDLFVEKLLKRGLLSYQNE